MRKQTLWGVALAALVAGPALAAEPKAGTKAEQPSHRAVTADKLTWGPPPPGLPSGAQAAVVEGDPGRAGQFVVRLRAPDGYTVRPHWHSQDEHITVLSGRLDMSMGEEQGKNVTQGGAGAYFSMPGGHRHAAQMKGPETIVQIHGQGPFDITYVNPTDDPRTKRSSR
jgi:quercetin dioxygenase-like cupin family protein